MSDEYEFGVALGSLKSDQRYQYRGKTWFAEDIYKRMTTPDEVVKLKYIVLLHKEDYQVFELQNNGIYRFYANAGYSFTTARNIAQAMNEKENAG